MAKTTVSLPVLPRLPPGRPLSYGLWGFLTPGEGGKACGGRSPVGWGTTGRPSHLYNRPGRSQQCRPPTHKATRGLRPPQAGGQVGSQSWAPRVGGPDPSHPCCSLTPKSDKSEAAMLSAEDADVGSSGAAGPGGEMQLWLAWRWLWPMAVTVAVFGREARCTGSVLQGDLEGLPQVRQKCVHIRPTPLCTWPKLGETPERPQSASAQ